MSDSIIERIEDSLFHVKYKDWKFEVFRDGDRPVMQIVTNKWKGRKWFLSPFMTNSEIVQTAFKAVLTAEEHETRKEFTYRRTAIFGPHINVEKLVELVADDPDALELRTEKEKV